MEERRPNHEGNHQLTLSNRKLLGVEGVVNLINYDQEQVILETSGGVLEIKGEHLHVQQLNLDLGKILIDGTVGALIYSDTLPGKKGKGFLGRLIK